MFQIILWSFLSITSSSFNHIHRYYLGLNVDFSFTIFLEFLDSVSTSVLTVWIRSMFRIGVNDYYMFKCFVWCFWKFKNPSPLFLKIKLIRVCLNGLMRFCSDMLRNDIVSLARDECYAMLKLQFDPLNVNIDACLANWKVFGKNILF